MYIPQKTTFIKKGAPRYKLDAPNIVISLLLLNYHLYIYD